MTKNRKPILLLATAAAASTAVAVPALATGAGTGAGAGATTVAAKPAVSDLDVDLVGGRTLDVTVETRRATTVKLTYAGTTRTARLDPDDARDRDQDHTARFTARAADRAEGKRVTIKVTATGAGGTTTKTLADRVDVEDDD